MNNNLNLLTAQYKQTGTSTKKNELGMREMQSRAFNFRDHQYILIKSPPASGKSRALMFLALDKMINQGISKTIVAVPEMSIGGSFKNTNLTQDGFFADWVVEPKYNLCQDSNDKVDTLINFLDPKNTANTLVCTHATLRFAYEKLGHTAFNNTLVGIDEFHHVSVEEDNKLGALIDGLMKNENTPIVAMTGSYFRGDAAPILLPEDEAKFQKVTYTYYEQLNGYTYLKTLGLNYHFYQGNYTTALKDTLDEHKKTIVHIPSVNSNEAHLNKSEAVDAIIDALGKEIERDADTGIVTIKTHTGRIIKLADLVDDNKIMRPRTQQYLANINHRDDVDIIVALGMAKEGFDWIYCEHVLTIGYRDSMTEVIQIIGRTTRDCEGKEHAQFTNLISRPDANDEDVKESVNTLLKAITLSLLMEQVITPKINFKARSQATQADFDDDNTIIIDDGTAPLTKKQEEILSSSRDEIIAKLSKDKRTHSCMVSDFPPEYIHQVLIPDIIKKIHPDLTPEDIKVIANGISASLSINAMGGIVTADEIPEDAIIDGELQFAKNSNGDLVEVNHLTPNEQQSLIQDDIVRERDLPKLKAKPMMRNGESYQKQKFINLNGRFINVDKLNINLIQKVNPFNKAYSVLSKNLSANILKTIQNEVISNQANVTEEEAVALWPKVAEFRTLYGNPDINSNDALERRYAQVWAFLQQQYIKKKREQQA